MTDAAHDPPTKAQLDEIFSLRLKVGRATQRMPRTKLEASAELEKLRGDAPEIRRPKPKPRSSRLKEAEERRQAEINQRHEDLRHEFLWRNPHHAPVGYTFRKPEGEL